MSFVSRNHPQQKANPAVDDRATTVEVFEPLNERFGFTVDAAALPHNAKLPRFWTPEDDGLAQEWHHERVWCNPPYSNIRPWVEKAKESRGFSALLLPANRTEQAWWQDLIEPYRDNGGRLTVEFWRGRTRFIAHTDTEVKPNSRPPFGCCLVIHQSRT